MKRRDFIKTSAGAAALSLLPTMKSFSSLTNKPDLVVVKDGEPAEMVKKAIETIGGMSRFISKGDIVVLKPNMSWDRVPEQAATTNPDVVSQVVKLCLEAGAKKVKIFDNTLNEARRCYKRSGIEKAAKEAGADVFFIMEKKFVKTKFPEGEMIKRWEVYEDVLEADKIINIPIAKTHNVQEAKVSLGMKNLMGHIGGNRGKFHRRFDVKITDLSTKIKPDLIILDAYRMLIRNGPTGGNLDDVTLKKCVAVGTDPVAVDSFGATLFGLDPKILQYLTVANQRGLGEIDLKKINILTHSFSS